MCREHAGPLPLAPRPTRPAAAAVIHEAPMPLPRVRIRTLMIAVAVAGVVSAAFASSDGFRLVFGPLLPGVVLIMSLAYTIVLACSQATIADDGEVNEL